jgi:hypothetical protein
MKTYVGSVQLPKSGVLVCLKTGTAITEEEKEALDEYFLALHPAVAPGGMDPDTGRAPEDDWDK